MNTCHVYATHCTFDMWVRFLEVFGIAKTRTVIGQRACMHPLLTQMQSPVCWCALFHFASGYIQSKMCFTFKRRPDYGLPPSFALQMVRVLSILKSYEPLPWLLNMNDPWGARSCHARIPFRFFPNFDLHRPSCPWHWCSAGWSEILQTCWYKKRMKIRPCGPCMTMLYDMLMESRWKICFHMLSPHVDWIWIDWMGSLMRFDDFVSVSCTWKGAFFSIEISNRPILGISMFSCFWGRGIAITRKWNLRISCIYKSIRPASDSS